jgi:hypothetical protein
MEPNGRLEATFRSPVTRTCALDVHLELASGCASEGLEEHVAPTDQRVAGPLRSDPVDQQDTELEFSSFGGRVAFLRGHLLFRSVPMMLRPEERRCKSSP